MNGDGLPWYVLTVALAAYILLTILPPGSAHLSGADDVAGTGGHTVLEESRPCGRLSLSKSDGLTSFNKLAKIKQYFILRFGHCGR